ncbi:hypothetical protein CsSME_00011329 [Camellia sinensis var. sinensis]
MVTFLKYGSNMLNTETFSWPLWSHQNVCPTVDIQKTVQLAICYCHRPMQLIQDNSFEAFKAGICRAMLGFKPDIKCEI